MSEKGTIPFLLTTARRINNSGKNSNSSRRNNERVNQNTTYRDNYQTSRRPNTYRFSRANKEKANERGYTNNREEKNSASYQQTPHETYEQPNKVNDSDNNRFNVHVEPKFEFDRQQREEIKDKMFRVAPILKTIGGAVSSIFGGIGKKIGQTIGGTVGHAVDFIGSLFSWF